MLSRPHIIRLREPWEVATQVDSPESVRVTLRRSFHRPTGLDAQSRMVLVIEGLEHVRAVTLNSRQLSCRQSSSGNWRCEVPTDLPTQNALHIEVEVCDPGNLDTIRLKVLAAGKVRLEIYEE